MYRLFCLLMAAIVCAAASAQGQTSPARPIDLTFQSSTYNDFRQLLAREAGKPVTVRAHLAFPDEAKDRYPAVIVLHAISGYSDNNEGYIAAALRKAGFATLTFDSFAARGTTGEAFSASPGYLAAGVADAYAALQLLARQPRIDAARVAILGFSFGADVAHMTAFEPLRSALVPEQNRFAAHVAFYPAGTFGVLAERGAYTGSPVLLLLGGKDDNLPVAKIDGYLAYARAAGHPAPIETVIYPDAVHAWTVPGVPKRFYADYVSPKKCPLLLLGTNRVELLVDGQAKPFDPNVVGACLRAAPGYWMGFDAAVRSQSIADAQRFLRRTLQP
jgi:dienelactone hydrolase